MNKERCFGAAQWRCLGALFTACALLCAAAGAAGGTQTRTTILDINFESMPSGDWRRGDANSGSGDDYWGVHNARAHNGAKAAWCAAEGSRLFVPNTSWGTYDNDMDAYWRTIPLDLRQYVEGEVSCYIWFDIEPQSTCNYDYFQLRIVDSVNTAQVLWQSPRYCGDSNRTWWLVESDIPANVFSHSGLVRGELFFHSDGSRLYEGVYVDDLILTASLPASPTPTRTVTRTPTITPSATPTPFGNPTNTPTPYVTLTPTVTMTKSPTITPTFTITTTPTRSPTFTPSPSPIASNTPPPTATEEPAEFLKLQLLLSQTLFAEGDLFRFLVEVRKLRTGNYAADLFIALDVYGEYFFWPSWGRDVAWARRTYANMISREAILEFIWPGGAGEAQGIILWGALTRPDTIDLYSWDNAVFSFTESTDPTPSPTDTPILPTATPTPTPAGTGTPPAPIELTVPGTTVWLDTGIDVIAGAIWIIAARGEICFHIGDCAGTTVGPCGYKEVCYDPECQSQPFEPGFHHGGLIAKVGPTGRVFLICDGYADQMPQSGRLYLGINDGNPADNGLQFEAIIYPPH